MKLISLVVALLAFLLAGPALAQTKLSGTFTAKQACPALQSIKKGTNPGDVTLVPDTGYKLLGGNKEPATYYWIVVPTAQPDFRWVPVTCGTTDATTAPPDTTSTTTTATPPAPGAAQYVLALSWEPAFCEGLPDKAECQSETAQSYEASHLALHGLWPQPRSKAYCNTPSGDVASDKAHNWSALPAVDLSAPTRSTLDAVMPGTKSLLERHEWIVHGTCSGASADTYFARAAGLARAINDSPVAALFAGHVGQRLDGTTIRAAFDAAFGKGAGDRVRLACDRDGGRSLISEITIGLSGDVIGSGKVDALIAGSAATDPGCPGGIVDPVGPQ